MKRAWKKTRCRARGKKTRVIYAFCCGADSILSVVPAKAGTHNPRELFGEERRPPTAAERLHGMDPAFARTTMDTAPRNPYFVAEKRLSKELEETIGWAPATMVSLGGTAEESEADWLS
jgi:hypothetical protein